MCGHPRAKAILAKYPSAQVVEIGHYKDVFCRTRQSHALQQRSQSLILAAKEGELLYKGAPVCQDFGYPYFYYTSCVMNCVYNCAYCYLKGMYPSANIVIFVNIEDIFGRVQQILKRHPLYLCVSYDTDLAALEPVAGYAREWSRFVENQGGRLTVEIRTKCASKHFFAPKPPAHGVIYAFTLSPQPAIDAYEQYTPSLQERVLCAAWAVKAGYAVRLCFDPMLYIPGWEYEYGRMLDMVASQIPMEKLVDASIGSFRIPQDYLKRMRRQEPDCAAVWFPFQRDHGVCHYPDGLMGQMEGYLFRRLKEKMPEEKIFLWGPGQLV